MKIPWELMVEASRFIQMEFMIFMESIVTYCTEHVEYDMESRSDA